MHAVRQRLKSLFRPRRPRAKVWNIRIQQEEDVRQTAPNRGVRGVAQPRQTAPNPATNLVTAPQAVRVNSTASKTNRRAPQDDPVRAAKPIREDDPVLANGNNATSKPIASASKIRMSVVSSSKRNVSQAPVWVNVNYPLPNSVKHESVSQTPMSILTSNRKVSQDPVWVNVNYPPPNYAKASPLSRTYLPKQPRKSKSAQKSDNKKVNKRRSKKSPRKVLSARLERRRLFLERTKLSPISEIPRKAVRYPRTSGFAPRSVVATSAGKRSPRHSGSFEPASSKRSKRTHSVAAPSNRFQFAAKAAPFKFDEPRNRNRSTTNKGEREGNNNGERKARAREVEKQRQNGINAKKRNNAELEARTREIESEKQQRQKENNAKKRKDEEEKNLQELKRLQPILDELISLGNFRRLQAASNKNIRRGLRKTASQFQIKNIPNKAIMRRFLITQHPDKHFEKSPELKHVLEEILKLFFKLAERAKFGEVIDNVSGADHKPTYTPFHTPRSSAASQNAKPSAFEKRQEQAEFEKRYRAHQKAAEKEANKDNKEIRRLQGVHKSLRELYDQTDSNHRRIQLRLIAHRLGVENKDDNKVLEGVKQQLNPNMHIEKSHRMKRVLADILDSYLYFAEMSRFGAKIDENRNDYKRNPFYTPKPSAYGTGRQRSRRQQQQQPPPPTRGAPPPPRGHPTPSRSMKYKMMQYDYATNDVSELPLRVNFLHKFVLSPFAIPLYDRKTWLSVVERQFAHIMKMIKADQNSPLGELKKQFREWSSVMILPEDLIMQVDKKFDELAARVYELKRVEATNRV